MVTLRQMGASYDLNLLGLQCLRAAVQGLGDFLRLELGRESCWGKRPRDHENFRSHGNHRNEFWQRKKKRRTVKVGGGRGRGGERGKR